MANFFGLDKIKLVKELIKCNGGLKASMLKVLRYDDLKYGKLVGVDKLGNRYYENNSMFIGRNRWVEYSDRYGYDYDGSCVSPEWFGWLHYKTDLLPSETLHNSRSDSFQSFLCSFFPRFSDKSRPKYKWLADPSENMSGTPEEYVPYTTTKQKIVPWVPANSKIKNK